MFLTNPQRKVLLNAKVFGLEEGEVAVPKARQVGLTTLDMCFDVAVCKLRPGYSCLRVFPDNDTFDMLREKLRIIVNSAIRNDIGFPSLKIDNKQSMQFSNGSTIRS